MAAGSKSRAKPTTKKFPFNGKKKGKGPNDKPIITQNITAYSLNFSLISSKWTYNLFWSR
jgi:hypothetical protein